MAGQVRLSDGRAGDVHVDFVPDHVQSLRGRTRGMAGRADGRDRVQPALVSHAKPEGVSSLLWHSERPDRMRRVLDVLAAHAPHPDLPVILGPTLRRTGFQVLRQQGVPIINDSYNENRIGFWVSRLAATFARGRGMDEADISAWLAEFPDLDARGEFFFSTTTILTEAVKVA